MKKSLWLIASVALLAACNSTPGYKISGTVANNPGLNGEYVYLYEYGVPGRMPIDSAVVKNGAFQMKGVQNSPELCIITFSEEAIPRQDKNKYAANRMMGPLDNDIYTAVLVLDNSDITVKLDTFSQVSGTPENDSLQVLINDMETYNRQAAPIAVQMKNFKNLNESDKNKLRQWYDQYISSRVDRAKTYVDRNLHKLSGAYVFSQYAAFMGDDVQSDVLTRADSTFKSLPGIDRIEDHVNVLKRVAVGQKFVNFSMENADGKTVQLSDYAGKGKYVLLDFWASWCSPCIKEMPELVKVYNKYHNKNFEIVGISLDENKEAWLKAIVRLDMKWPQLSDLKGWENQAAQIYGVTSIPYTILLSPDGVIMDKWLNAGKLDTTLQGLVK